MSQCCAEYKICLLTTNQNKTHDQEQLNCSQISGNSHKYSQNPVDTHTDSKI